MVRSLAPSSRSSRMQKISAFTISLRYGDARTVAEVVNTLASDFVTENLKMRESHVLGTSAFLFDELASVEERLAKKEEELKQYREKYMGGLPEQLDTNLKILERLQQQLDQLNSNLREAENRKILIQQQIAESTVLSATGEALPRDIHSLRKELASLELRYSESHPDIIILRKMIAKLETEISKIGTGLAEGNLLPGVDEGLRHQFQNVALEIKDFKAEIKEVQSETRWYEIKVKESPKREQELLILTRNYNNLQKLYDSLFSKKVEAEIAVSMEKKQKGEQFRIIEPAIIPTSPVAPNAQIVIIMTLALGLGLGGGLAVLKEAMDTSYKTPEEVKKGLHLPILAELPIRYTERELKDIKRKNTFAFAAVGLGFILSAIGIALAANGVDKTLDFAKNLFSGM